MRFFLSGFAFSTFFFFFNICCVLQFLRWNREEKWCFPSLLWVWSPQSNHTSKRRVDRHQQLNSTAFDMYHVLFPAIVYQSARCFERCRHLLIYVLCKAGRHIVSACRHRHTKRYRTFICPSQPPCLLYTSPSPRDKRQSRMPSSA